MRVKSVERKLLTLYTRKAGGDVNHHYVKFQVLESYGAERRSASKHPAPVSSATQMHPSDAAPVFCHPRRILCSLRVAHRWVISAEFVAGEIGERPPLGPHF
ncbi:hypothetical protein CDAR_239981 [Caerostris darwini]|uniref:Uncharacterized protein n=1 Tax=Caerostris darwini TaxID=1538125 RepID=A0AAV4T259_9ARAC|nr:hypothetical protein CDAR_239981 [Caerostris darwini]